MDTIRNILSEGNPLLTGGISLGAILAGIILHFLLFRILEGVAKRNESHDLKVMSSWLKKPSLALFILISIFFLLPFFRFEDVVIRNIRHVLSLVVIFTVAWTAVNATVAVHHILRFHFNMEVKDNLRARKVHTQLRVMERIIIAFIIIIAVSTGLMTFEKIRQLGLSLLASAGIAGVALGFAAQRTLALVLAGIQVAFTQPIRLDDVLIVENEWGKVEEITLTYVVVVIWDERRLVVPMTYFIEKPFQNWTRRTSNLIGTVFIHVDYTLKVDEMRKELTRVLGETELWDGRVNVLQVTDAKAKSMELRALVSACDAPTLWDLRVYVREKLVAWLQREYPEALPFDRIQLSGDAERKTGNGNTGPAVT